LNTTDTGSADGLLKAAAGLLGGSGADRQALEGIRVLDIATFFAAPS
jgi:hypothetical protein